MKTAKPKPSFEARHAIILGVAMVGGVGIGTAAYQWAKDERLVPEERKADLRQGAVAALSLLTLYVTSKFSWGDWFNFEKAVTKVESGATKAIESL